MKKLYSLFIVMGLILISIIWTVLADPAQELSESELRDRVNKTRTDWANYHEDLKGQIGSTPVARWKGEPTQSRVQENTIEIDFEISGYWTQTEVNLPILIRDPLGKTYPDTSSTRKDGIVTYSFRIPSGTDQLSWIELKYPHATRRIAYTDDSWSANGR